MGRIRTIKPEFFLHDGLYDLEEATQLPIRLAFTGLFTVSDREGRFKWEPRRLKLQILPYDNVDFSGVLDALENAGFVKKYTVQGSNYGVIPTFNKHQVINNRESSSVLPDPITYETPTRDPHVNDACPTRAPRVNDASPTPLGHAQGVGKGREGMGKEKELSSATPKTGCSKPFEKFWKLYPNDLGAKGPKSVARVQYQMLKPDEELQTKIIAALTLQTALKRQQREETGWSENFPHVERWLNHHRWEDELYKPPLESEQICCE